MRIPNGYGRREGSRMTNPKWKLQSRVWAFRVTRNLSQQALADKVGVSRKTIYQIETGDSAPSVGLALAIARQMNVSVHDIFVIK